MADEKYGLVRRASSKLGKRRKNRKGKPKAIVRTRREILQLPVGAFTKQSSEQIRNDIGSFTEPISFLILFLDFAPNPNSTSRRRDSSGSTSSSEPSEETSVSIDSQTTAVLAFQDECRGIDFKKLSDSGFSGDIDTVDELPIRTKKLRWLAEDRIPAFCIEEDAQLPPEKLLEIRYALSCYLADTTNQAARRHAFNVAYETSPDATITAVSELVNRLFLIAQPLLPKIQSDGTLIAGISDNQNFDSLTKVYEIHLQFMQYSFKYSPKDNPSEPYNTFVAEAHRLNLNELYRFSKLLLLDPNIPNSAEYKLKLYRLLTEITQQTSVMSVENSAIFAYETACYDEICTHLKDIKFDDDEEAVLAGLPNTQRNINGAVEDKDLDYLMAIHKDFEQDFFLTLETSLETSRDKTSTRTLASGAIESPIRCSKQDTGHHDKENLIPDVQPS